MPSIAVAIALCQALTSTPLGHTTITVAESVTGGAFTPAGATAPISGLPGFCRVAGEIRPTPDSHILFELWLPLENWNGKFSGVGNGGFAGTISFAALAGQLRRGYASVSTNTGHVAGGAAFDGARFGYDHPDQLIDFAHRAIHEMTIVGKILTRAMYERDPSKSYFIGCSTGGRQALMEAQRYPDDYDGIIAGAPANNLNRMEAQSLDAMLAMGAESGSYLTPAVAAVLARGVLDKCDAIDGVRDGVIENPAKCVFDPQTVQCRAGQSEGCLTPAQVAAAKRVYAGLANARTGEKIYPGFALGSEANWSPLNPAQPFPIPISHFMWWVMRDSTWDWTKFNFQKAADLDAFLAADKSIGPWLNAFDTDLTSFRKNGGKLIQYHGWNDNLISPHNSVDYFERVVARLGGKRDEVQNFYRLFMVPGMGHCNGGPGPNVFDMQAALEGWVEKNEAPQSVIAVHKTGGTQDRSRPLCPYPATAAYKGKGDSNDAGNFECRQ